MSWRDRLPRRDPGDSPGPASSRADDPIGTIGNEAFLTTARSADAGEQPGPDQPFSGEAVSGWSAASAKRADRALTSLHIAAEIDAISAERANSADDGHPAERDRDAICAESADRGGGGTWGDYQEERAAIVEYDGDLTRAWAEGFARLDPKRPPGDAPAKRWLRFIDDVGRFLDGPFLSVAEALGWGPHDLFGCDRDRPFGRIDRAGLLWLLNGDQLLALTENTATIETRTGARQTYRRKPDEPGRVLPWEIAP
jgi:hypothetical protein